MYRRFCAKLEKYDTEEIDIDFIKVQRFNLNLKGTDLSVFEGYLEITMNEAVLYEKENGNWKKFVLKRLHSRKS